MMLEEDKRNIGGMFFFNLIPLVLCGMKGISIPNDQYSLKIMCLTIRIRRFSLDITFFDKIIQGVPKKVSVKPIFKFQTLGGVFFGVKNNSKNFGNKDIVGSLAKF